MECCGGGGAHPRRSACIVGKAAAATGNVVRPITGVTVACHYVKVDGHHNSNIKQKIPAKKKKIEN